LPGEFSKTLQVRLIDNAVPDGDRNLLVTLSNPVNGTLGTLSNTVLNIIDNESISTPAGSLDTTFNALAAANAAVYALTRQNDGKLIMAGDFTQVSSVPRNRLARLKASGVLDNTFDIGPGANDSIRALALTSEGKLLVGGLFTTINGTNRSRIARLSTDGKVDISFNPGAGADNPVFALAIQPNDKVLVGGSFNAFNNITRPGLVRLNTNGTVDATFNVGAGFNGTVYAIGLQNDGKILVGGDFISFNGVARTNFVRLNVNGSLDLSFNPALYVSAPVRAIVMQPDGRIVIGGSFTNINGFTRNYLARLDKNGVLDPSFLPGGISSGGDNTVYAIAQQVDGRLLVAGDFTIFNNVTRRGITRLFEADGATDPTINFGSGANAFVAAMLIQPDRRIVIGGGFTEYDDQPRQHIARIYGGSIEGAGSLEFSRPVFLVSESSSNAIVTLRRRGGTTGEVRVDGFTQNGSAISGVDYLGVTNTLIFPQGETRQLLNIPILPNTVLDGDRTVNLLLAGFVNAIAGPQPIATLIIQDDETRIGFSSGNFAVNENAISGNGTVTLVRQGATNTSVTVDIATVLGGSATPGVDYVPTNATVSFLPGEVTKLFNVHVINDLELDGNESILLVLSNPSGTTTLGISNAVLNLIDDESGAGQFLFSSSNFVGDESGGSVIVTVLRTNGFTGIVSVRLTTSNLTATAFSDYTPTNRVLTFSDGETNKSIAIPIVNDANAEPDETVLLTLSQPTGGATILTTNALITIADDEIVPSYVGFLTNNFYVDESAGVAVVSVVRTNSRRGFLTVDFSVSNGSAFNGSDYVATNGTLTFLDGVAVQTFTIPIINDSIGEGTETVRLSLFNLQGTNTSLVLPTSTLNILDDDSTLRFSSSTYTVAENAGSALITVERVGVTNNPVSITYSTTTGGTALPGIDYTPVTGVLTWLAGDGAPKTFTIPIIDNNVLNQNKTVALLLSNAVGISAFVSSPSNAVLTITDDEAQNPVSGVVDPTFNGNFGANATVFTVAFDSQERLYVGGAFTQIYGLAINRIARFATNGAVDLTFDPGTGADAPVHGIARGTNSIYVGGAFTNINGVNRRGIAKLRLDGTVDTAFNPGTGANGTVFAVASLPNDQVIIGGQFTSINGGSAGRIARLNPNGLLDQSFNPGSGANGAVRAVVVQDNGQIIIGGDFTSVNGFLPTRLARLNADGVLDTSFDTSLGADGTVRGLSLQADGKIIVVGDFQTINGAPRAGIARLNTDGSVDFSFDPGAGANGIVRAVVVQPDNRVVVAGDFTSFDGSSANGVARLNADGSNDNTFEIGAGANAPVHALALANVTSTIVIPRQATGTDLEDRLTVDTGANSGTIIIDYDFLGVPDNIRVYYDGVRVFDLTTNGFAQLVIPFGPGQSTFVTVIMNEGGGMLGTAWFYTLTIVTGARLDNRIALGGDFTKIDNQPRGRVAIINSTGSLYPVFDPRTISTRSVYALGPITNTTLPSLVGKVMVGGDFTAIVGVNQQNRVARLNIDGTLDRTFRTGVGFNNTVQALGVQADGKTIVGGLFTSYDFISRSYLARLNVDGSVDNTFNSANNGANINNPVYALALQPDGKVVIGGAFTIVYGAPRNSIARMNANGTIDVTFTPGSGANGAVRAVALQGDGKVLIGGDFTSFNGVPRSHIARLNTNGTLDATFDPGTGANGTVNAIAVTSTGGILMGGTFTTVNGTAASRLARLTSSGALDGTFNAGTGANDYVSSIVIQPDGRILVSGNFTTFNGQIRNRLVRLNSDGSLDPTTNFGAGANDLVAAIALQNYDSKILVGGSFTEFDGLTRIAVARLFGGTNTGLGTFHFSSPTYTVNENGGNAVILVTRAGGTLGAASVGFSTVNGTATAPSDFTAVSGTLNFASAESVKQIIVPINDNASATGDRTFGVTLFNPSPGASIDSPSNAVVTILDNDSIISFAESIYLVNESAALARITVTRTGGVVEPATVDFATGVNGTATAGVDFTPVSGTLTFPAGARVRTFDVPILDDAVNEFDETVPLALFNPTGSSSLGLSTATLAIVENDFGAGVITFGTNSYFASEDGGPIVIELFRINGHSGAVRVNYQTLTGSATPNVDYRTTNSFVDFADGQTNAFITILPIDDLLTEGNETVPVQLFSPSGGAALGLSLATITIVDNDAPGTFVFSSATYSISEAGGAATITVIRTNGNQGFVSVTVQTSGGTATPTLDYAPVAPTVLSFNPGQTVRTITIPIVNDLISEGTETVGLLLSNPTGGTSISVPGAATLSILDDEASVGFASAALSATESFTNVLVTLVRTGNTNFGFSVTLNTSDGTATAGADYVSTTTTVTFAPGQTNATLTVAVLDDTLAEGDETVNLTLSSPSGGVVLGPIGTSVLTILDNDTAYNFSSATYATNEGTVNLVITVLRAGFNLATGSVDFATS
ncbi:MAG TPA: Calx-beta domain-containing protein, partial [Verrucomicrobiae bacterium]